MEPWYKVATLRKEVREGRSFNPDEFAIALEQVVAGTDFVGKGEFGLGSGRKSDGTYDRMWFQELMASDEVAYEADVFLLRKTKAESTCNSYVANQTMWREKHK